MSEIRDAVDDPVFDRQTIMAKAADKADAILEGKSFSEINDEFEPNSAQNFIALLVFILGLTIPSLVLAAEVRKKSEAENIRAQQDLEARILWRASKEAATAGSLEDVLADCLEQICKVANWQIGHVYLPDRADDPELLYPSSIWYFESKKF
jgi:K+-sensing histidine kinase KdpD